MGLQPKNWSSFQHYTNRRPPWVKLHHSLLDDYEFHCLPVASKALAPMLWLLASEYQDGKISLTDREVAFRMRMVETDFAEAIEPLIGAGFFNRFNDGRAERKQVASKMLASKSKCGVTETEREAEKESEADTVGRCATRPRDRFDEFWNEYPKRDGSNPKEPARKKFLALIKSGADQSEIIAGAKNYRADMRARGEERTKFVAQAITWLNQERWKDHAQKAPPPVTPSPDDAIYAGADWEGKHPQ